MRDDLQDNEWPLWIQRALHGLHSLLEHQSLLVIDDESARIVALGPSSVEEQDQIAHYNAPFLTRKSISLGIVLRPVGRGMYSSVQKPSFADIYNDIVYKIMGPCFMLADSESTLLPGPPSATRYSVQII